MSAQVLVCDDAEAAAQDAAERLADRAARGGHVALSGGSTPRQAYELAAGLQPDWSAVELWWVDERCVPPEADESNYRLVRESLLDRLAAPPRSLHRVRGEEPCARAAAAYDAELDGVVLDFVLLGIGGDGHTASLFPSAPALAERARRAVAAEAKLEPYVDRVTLTLPVLEAAGEAIFLVTGEAKADAVAVALSGREDADVPASFVIARRPDTVVILDRPAAARFFDGKGEGEAKRRPGAGGSGDAA